MINYYISYEKPHRHYVNFKLIIDTKNEKKIQFQLAAWRPGRYELGNFSQNISNWRVENENNELLNFKKITKDLWQVETESSKKITITYSFYANQLDAGSCYLDEYQLYLNPVHCIFLVNKKISFITFIFSKKLWSRTFYYIVCIWYLIDSK